MGDLKHRLERGLAGFQPREDVDGAVRRATRRHRSRRIGAATLALVVTVAGVAVAARQFGPPPERLNAPLGSLSGEMLVFSSYGVDLAEGQPLPARDLYAIRPDGTGLVRLTDSPEDDSGAAVSPDGSKIAFVRDHVLWMMDADRSNARKLNGYPIEWSSAPSWSPNGESIAVSIDEWCLYSRKAHTCPAITSNAEIAVVDVATGEATAITHCPILECDGDIQPSWSPDASTIAYVHPVPVEGPFPNLRLRQIHLVHVDSGEVSQLTHGDNIVDTPRWSPDGSRLVVEDAEGRILILNAVTGQIERELLSGRTQLGSQPAWSPDGETIAYLGGSPAWDINAVGTDGMGSHVIAALPGTESDLTWAPGDATPEPPVISPGEIAFSASHDNNSTSLEVMRSDGTGRRVIVPAQGAYAHNASWSPDGDHLAFIRGMDGRDAATSELVVVNADGSGLRVLMHAERPDYVTGVDWSPVGDALAVARSLDGRGSIWRVDPANGASTPITGPGPGQSDEQPAWSPDGKRLVFARSLGRGRTDLYPSDVDLFVVDADGSNLRLLLERPYPQFGPRWSPDGTTVLFESSNADDLTQLMTIGRDGSGLREIKTGVWRISGGASWSADGAWVVFSGQAEYGTAEFDEQSDLYAFPAEGGTAVQLTSTPESEHGAAWKPASRLTDDPAAGEIAFVEGPNDSGEINGPIIALRPDGTGRRVVIPTETGVIFEGLAWSPDGSEMAYVRRDEGGEGSALWISDASGSSRRPLLEAAFPENIDSPAWSPDGSEIAFSRWSKTLGSSPLWAIDVESGQVRQLTAPPSDSGDYEPSWSPDGEWIAFGRARGGDASVADLLRVPARGRVTQESDQAEILRATIDIEASPEWSPRGDQILFTWHPVGRPEESVAMLLDVDSATEPGSWEVHRLKVAARGWRTWSPDGKQIAFTQGTGGIDGATDLYVASLDGSDLVRLTETSEFETYLAWRP
jgi:TolB protein